MPYIHEQRQIRTKGVGVSLKVHNQGYDRQVILEMMKVDSKCVEEIYLVNTEIYVQIKKKHYLIGNIKQEYLPILSLNKGIITDWSVTGGYDIEHELTTEKAKYGINIIVTLNKIT